MKAGSSYFLTNDGSKLTLAQKSSNKRPTELKLYSNNQLWAVSPGGSEYCLHVDHKEKLQDLDGLDVKLAGGEQGDTINHNLHNLHLTKYHVKLYLCRRNSSKYLFTASNN